jgi:hypothetical protein
LNSLAQGAQFDLIYSSFDLLAIPFVCTMPAFPSSFSTFWDLLLGQGVTVLITVTPGPAAGA